VFGETTAEAFALRYGVEGVDLPEIGRFLNHRSVRRYTDEDIQRPTMEALIGVAQGAASSSNLQLYSIVTVRDPELRAAVNGCCDNQKQVATAPWFLAFVVDFHRLRQAATVVGEPCEGLDLMEFLLVGVIDAALAAERLVCAAEEMGIGTCYIGALRNKPDEIARLLNLPDGCFGVFGLCLGWPADERAHIKPRLPQTSVWFEEQYDPDRGQGDYDERMKGFYAQEGQSTEFTWTQRSGKRCRPTSVSGREVWIDFLHRRGVATR